MAGHPPPQRRLNAVPSEDERLEGIKQAYVDGLIDIEKMEEDIKFVLEGGYFAGSYARQFEIKIPRR